MEKQYGLAPRDAQLLAAAAMFMYGYSGFGAEAAEYLNAQERIHPKMMPLTQGAIGILSSPKFVEGSDAIVGAQKDPQAFRANTRRLLQLSQALVEFTLEPTTTDGPVIAAPAPERGPKIIDVDGEGNPVFEPSTEPAGGKTYALNLTHDEIHILFWAIMLAEAVRDGDLQGSQEAMATYKRLHDAFDMEAFVTKFDETHKLARVDDGEIDG